VVVLSQILTSVEVNCLPTNVPDNILVDVSGMELNSNMTIADIVDIPEDVEILSDLESTIATLAPPKEEEEPVIEELEDGEELPEGEEADDGETTPDQEQPTGDKDDGKEGDNKESSDGGSG